MVTTSGRTPAAGAGAAFFAAGGREVLFAAWRIFFERIARHGTTVLLFEDLQWADGGQLDVAVIGASLADELGLDPAETVGTTITIDGKSYGVVGVLDEVGVSFVPSDDAVIVPLAGAEGSILDRDPDYSQVRVSVDGDPAEASAEITEALRASRGTTEGDDDPRQPGGPTHGRACYGVRWDRRSRPS